MTLLWAVPDMFRQQKDPLPDGLATLVGPSTAENDPTVALMFIKTFKIHQRHVSV
jgi:hypothetical protein